MVEEEQEVEKKKEEVVSLFLQSGGCSPVRVKTSLLLVSRWMGGKGITLNIFYYWITGSSGDVGKPIFLPDGIQSY